MEKQVNKFHNTRMFKKTIQIIVLLVVGSNFSVTAQETKLDKGEKYILGGITITGKTQYSEQTINTFSGLEIGQEIIIPGEDVSVAIKKLWKLGLFSDVNYYVNEIKGDSIFLELELFESPKIADVKIQGLKKGKTEELIKETDLKKGKVVNDNLITTTKNYIENKFKKDGFYNAKAYISTTSVDSTDTEVKMLVTVDKGDKVKVSSINFEGNEQFTDKKLKRAFKNTKEKNVLRIFKASKYIETKYEEDLKSVVNKYKENGYRDARIVDDKVVFNKEKNTIAIDVKVEEGKKYYFGDIRFLGNTIYTDAQLNSVLAINKGETYNGVLLQKRVSDAANPDADDIANQYQNNGYLFSTITPVEVGTSNDTINFEIRVVEGPIAYFNNITVVGNDKTNDHVIYRELKTKPGKKYSKEDLVRTVRDLGQLGYFDPEAIDPQFKNVDAQAGTVDIEFKVAEKGASQVELQGGYGGGGFIGTLGLSFNNFSVRNIFNKKAYQPLPMGDGQKMSLRLQASSYFQTYSLSFQEPWFGGKKPISFSTSISHSKQFLYNYQTRDVTKDRSFNITSLSVGMAKQLTVPDDYFVLSQSVSFQYYDLNNYNTGLFTFGNGSSKNIAYTIALSRNSKGNNPIFPTYGSEFTITGRFTPPYSLINGIDYDALKKDDAYRLRYDSNSNLPTTANSNGEVPLNGDYINLSTTIPGRYEVVSPENAALDRAKYDQKRFNVLEYYKLKLKADWYTRIAGKLVLKTLGEFGYMGAYDQARGLVPFERFYLGGDGLANFALDGREVIQLRGYPNNSLSSQDGGTVYNKFSLELRHPITLKPAASIYALAFVEAGSAFDNFKQYNPFKLQRSAGIGLRVFMPAFGLLGIDFAHGFDAIPGTNEVSGWQPHFIIGQQF